MPATKRIEALRTIQGRRLPDALAIHHKARRNHMTFLFVAPSMPELR